MAFSHLISKITFPFVIILILTGTVQADQHLVRSSEFVRSLAQQAIDTLTEEGISNLVRRKRFRNICRESFAINGIAKFALGRYWRNTTENTKTEYLSLFEDVIVATWADKFSLYSGEKFEIQNALDASIRGRSERTAIVRSIFYLDTRSQIRVDWRVSNYEDLYKVTDVTIQGISMSKTTRDEFYSVIRGNAGDINALLKLLREKRNR
jgi:phospholipid transport system substrate-binding protein|tara:strand:+ start:10919 stop:11545 length:627 start_codon:yes stop_codon:yes gene_type:complete